MRGENDAAFAAARGQVADHVPHEAARHGVHARAGLVQEHDAWASDHRDRDAQLPLVAARVATGLALIVPEEVHLTRLLLDHVVDVTLGDALDTGVEGQVLPACEVLIQRIELRAVANQATHAHRIRQQVMPVESRGAPTRRELPAEHTEQSCLPCPVDTEEAKALSILNAKTDTFDRHLSGGILVLDIAHDNQLVVRGPGGNALVLVRNVLFALEVCNVSVFQIVPQNNGSHALSGQSNFYYDCQQNVDHRLPREEVDIVES
mmetsp:Transcript_19487/g.73726  ORF Transcript_19487/g.73726 Transcript_19487/m.73726 type:complete len:263 (-) Transcript_19487:3000-3788(-)